MIEETTNSAITGINNVVDIINTAFNSVSNGNGAIFVGIIAVILGYLLKSNVDSNNETFYWILFTILIYMSLRYIGLGQ